MKRTLFSVFIIMVAILQANAKTYTLSSETNENGEIIVYNSSNGGKVKDKLHVENNTNNPIHITIKGEDNSGRVLLLASDFIKARDMQFLRTSFEDKLKDFRKFIISIENGKILNYKAEIAWSDLYFYVNETKQLNNSMSTSAADELLKWKKLLDAEVITKEEFEAKKKQLLGL